MICIFVSAGCICSNHILQPELPPKHKQMSLKRLYIYKAIDVDDVMSLIEMQCEISIGVKVDDALPIEALRY